MSDDQEKTEEPTAKKIEDARKEGNVPKSQDSSSFITLLFGMVAFFLFLPYMQERKFNLYLFCQSYIGIDLDKNDIYVLSITILKEFALMVLPLAIVVALAGVLAAFMQFGFLVTSKPLIPDFKKIDPVEGFKNLFSIKKFIEGIKIVLKVAFVMSLAYYYLLDFIKELPTVVHLSVHSQLVWMGEKAVILILVMLILFLGLAIFDLLFVRYNYYKDLRMSKQEVKDEFKQMEGDPQLKARIKRVQAEMSNKRMMSEIPTADVIIINQTHIAVAIRYNTEKESAPKVLAKGIEHLALKIKEIAMKNEVQVVENPTLARDLYKECKVDETISKQRYKEVAEVLAFVYQSSNKKRKI